MPFISMIVLLMPVSPTLLLSRRRLFRQPLVSERKENVLTVTYDSLTTDENGNDAVHQSRLSRT